MMTRRNVLGSAMAMAAVSPAALAQDRVLTRKVRARDGVELFLKDTGGSGRPAVMTHAWPLNADIWDEYEGVSHGLVVTEVERVSRDLIAFLQA